MKYKCCGLIFIDVKYFCITVIRDEISFLITDAGASIVCSCFRDTALLDQSTF